MSLIDQQFAKLRSENRKAFMPFITAGDPHIEFSEKLIRAFDDMGCSFCEIGVPYSDPIADGPVIQASYARALDQGLKVAHIMEMGKRMNPTISMPTVLMVSYAIVYRHGPEAFAEKAASNGYAGLIIPDLPVEESPRMLKSCDSNDISLIQLVAPTTPKDRAIQIAESSSGFLYYVSVTGITGERTTLPPDIQENIMWLKDRAEIPVCVGFGISQPEHVKALAPVADGLIVGSAIVRKMVQAADDPDGSLESIRTLVNSLMAANV